MVIYKAMEPFIDPDLKPKMNLTSKNNHPDLLALYHPCQLETRFGGIAESPVNFWPPYVGPHFIPEDQIETEKLNYVELGPDFERMI